MADLPPGLILILGALLVPLLRSGPLRNAYMLTLPLAGLLALTQMPVGTTLSMELFGYALTPVRVDRLSLVFGYVFHIAATLGVIYAFHLRDTMQQVAALVYAGTAIAGAFAGDLITLFVFWEGTAVASVFLVWASRTEASYRAGMRYLIIQVASGVLLLAGAVIVWRETGLLSFDRMTLGGLGPTLIFIAFGIKAAFPLLHNWVQDAYPQSTVTGTVFLSAFTTKLAIYALARGFAGTEELIWIGAVMTVFPIFYAIIENDLRRVLSYSLNVQLGFMVTAIGIGTEMALNGAAAHAFAHVLYKALLFMAIGAVLFRTGSCKASDLGGLYRSMPWTATFCIVGAASISAFPLFSGFVTKSLIITATGENGPALAWFMLMFASAAAMLYVGIRVPYLAFFQPGPSAQPAGGGEAPANMLVAMGATAFLCIAFGIWADPLYAILPFTGGDYHAYTVAHVVNQLQLLVLAALVFGATMRTGLYPPVMPSMNLDFDWVYRRLLPASVRAAAHVIGAIDGAFRDWAVGVVMRLIDRLSHHHGPASVLARSWPTGATVIWVAVLLLGYMLFFFL